jgi:hypothetical protein
VYTLIYGVDGKYLGCDLSFYPLKLSIKYEKAKRKSLMFVENMGRSKKKHRVKR